MQVIMSLLLAASVGYVFPVRTSNDLGTQDYLSKETLMAFIEDKEVEARTWQENALRNEQKDRISAMRDLLQRQLAENRRWESAATDLFNQYAKAAEAAFARRSYVEARKILEKALSIQYPRWVFTGATSNVIVEGPDKGKRPEPSVVIGVTGVTTTPPPAVARRGSAIPQEPPDKSKVITEEQGPSPAITLELVSPAGAQAAQDRIAQIQRIIDDENLTVLENAADQAYLAGNYGTAYTGYDELRSLARQVAPSDRSQRAIATSDDRINSITTALYDQLDKASKAAEGDRGSDAAAVLDAVKASFGVLLDQPQVRVRYRTIEAMPSVMQERKEQKAALQLALGKAAIARGDYVGAKGKFVIASRLFPQTKAGAEAAAELDRLETDPAMIKAIEDQTARVYSQGRMALALSLLQQKRMAEATAVYDEIIAKYPNSEWSKQAAAKKAELAAEK